MLLTLGLTADAAAAHRHEFSSQQQTTPSRSTSPATPWFPVSSPWATVRANAPTARTPPQQISAAAANTPTIETVMDAEAESDTQSDDAWSQSSASTVTVPAAPTINRPTAPKPKNRERRSKTKFQLAHPPPTIIHRQRLHIRPKLLLQLHYISQSARPTPALDVLPSTIFAPRLARKFPRFFKGKEGLGADDLIIVGCDKYHSQAAGRSQNESWESRQVVATICQQRKDETGIPGRAEICLKDGPLWEATPLKTGAYEFVADDGSGSRITARWVPRKSVGRRRSGSGVDRAQPAEDEKMFNFSLINPQSRRHPVIASITPSTLEILDSYRKSSPPSPPISSSPDLGIPKRAASAADPSLNLHLGYFDTHQNHVVETDEALQTLILITGVYVASREGWSPNFKSGSTDANCQSQKANATTPADDSASSHHRCLPATSTISPGARCRATSFSVRDRLARSGGNVMHRPEAKSSSANAGAKRSLGRANSTDAACMGGGSQESALDGWPSTPTMTSRALSHSALMDQSQSGTARVFGDDRDEPTADQCPDEDAKPPDRSDRRRSNARERSRWGKIRGILALCRGAGATHGPA
ncbi:MAG: hypothetical protein M1837_004245 [Sclerophora amabilis]|nr:MAG: hypothetical protein M1837_004245 [Sclerophora amabilis]